MSNPAFALGLSLQYRQNVSVLPINDTAYVPDENDVGSLLQFLSASASTLTVPPDSTLQLPVGALLTACRSGTGAVNIAAGPGVTINKPASLTAAIANQHQLVQLVKTAANTWMLFGALAS